MNFYNLLRVPGSCGISHSFDINRVTQQYGPHLVRGVASRLNLIRSIELAIFEGKGLEVALAGQAAVGQACVTVVLVSHVHLYGVVDVQHEQRRGKG